MSKPSQRAGAVGATGGTTLASMALLLPDGLWKTLLIIASPMVTVGLSHLWPIASDEVRYFVGSRRLNSRISKTKKLIAEEEASANPNPEVIARARGVLSTLSMSQVDLATTDLKAITAPTGKPG